MAHVSLVAGRISKGPEGRFRGLGGHAGELVSKVSKQFKLPYIIYSQRPWQIA